MTIEIIVSSCQIALGVLLSLALTLKRGLAHPGPIV
jgi:hypothetical protein